MGFEPGRGLGRFGQGRADIIEASQQRGRRGLGFRVEGFDDKDFTWEEEEEVHLLLYSIIIISLFILDTCKVIINDINSIGEFSRDPVNNRRVHV